MITITNQTAEIALIAAEQRLATYVENGASERVRLAMAGAVAELRKGLGR
jgi:hypothetical protein